MKLYSWQNPCIQDLRSAFTKSNKACLAWYTGAGKTNVFIQWLKEEIEKNSNIRIGISAYLTNEIREQIADRLAEFGLNEKTQVFGSRLPKVMVKNIAVFNPQSLYKIKLNKPFDILVIDEGHAGMGNAKMISEIRKKNCTKKTKILLVSATPWDTLAMDEFKGCPVLKRPLDQGLADGMITDFNFHAEEAQIEFKEDDFSRKGDLTKQALHGRMPILKSVCEAKMEYLIREYGPRLGKKVLVICPPGNFGEIPRHLAEKFDGLPYLQTIDGSVGYGAAKRHETGLHMTRTELDTKKNLEKFMADKTRFLFVIHKCNVGFDMKELDSVIDLTMTRNIRSLAQRVGRIARKNGDAVKRYFYVYDKSLVGQKLEWLVTTMIDFSLGAYEGWTTGTAKYRKSAISGQAVYLKSTTLTQILKEMRDPEAIKTREKVAFVDYSPPTQWTIHSAREAAKEYKDRTDMWRKKPGLYKWFRLNAKHVMDEIFPLKRKNGIWNKKTVIRAMKKSKGRRDFHERFGGADYWMQTFLTPEEREAMKQEHLGDSKSKVRWNDEVITELLKSIRTWSHIRTFGGARKWMHKNGGENFWRLKWEKIHGKKYRGKGVKPYERAKHKGYAHVERKKGA